MKSLADVRVRLETDARLDPVRRRKYLGALRTMSSMLGRSAETLPNAMSEIDRLLRALPVPAHGRSKKTIANTRSVVKAALLHVTDAPKLPSRGMPLRPEWAKLYNSVTDLRLRTPVAAHPHRLISWCRTRERR